MSWSDDSGLHEGYVAPVFADGYTGGGSTTGHVIVTTDPEGQMMPHKRWEDRPMADVVGWLVGCDCSDRHGRGSGGRRGWTGMRWERVPRVELEDLTAGRLYSSDDATADVEDREDVHQVAVASWRGHAAPQEGLADLEQAARAVAAATHDLTETVRRVRDNGASWADVGRAVGITRQSARERWG